MPKISIIVPNYNHAPYLKERLDTIFNQTFTDFEVILLDDASLDESVSILQKYNENHKEKVSHLIVNERNSGTTFLQWKKGIDLAKGEYIWIAESDDYCENTMLEKLYQVLSRKPQAAVAAANLIQVNADGKYLQNRTRYKNITFSSQKVLTQHFTSGTYLWNASAVLFRKSAVQNIDWEWITSLKYCGDWLFWSQLLQTGGLITLKEPLSYFRVHQKSVSSLEASRYRTFTEGLEIVKWILSKYSLSYKQRLAAYYAWWKKLKTSQLDANSEKVFLIQIRTLFNIVAPNALEALFKTIQLKNKLKKSNSKS